jgi:SAM-dependent methyltransferase
MDVPQGALVLDYGCAKSATLRKLAERRPDVIPHFFDVSDDYIEFWARFASPDTWATHQLKPEWQGRFDIVSSFFSFEHIDEVTRSLHDIALVMKPGAAFYCVVPNLFTNIADFVVVDHINHFTETSLRYALNSAGFTVTEIDANAHRGAFVIVARKTQATAEPELAGSRVLEEQKNAVKDIARFWRDLDSRIARVEDQLGDNIHSAIYGAGFYGTYIGMCLRNLDSIECFIDQNPFLQGKRLFDKPVLAPESLPRQVHHVYVGLNPAIARNAMASMDVWRGRNLNYSFLTD